MCKTRKPKEKDTKPAVLYTARDGQSASEYRTGSREDLRIDLNRRTSGSALVIPTGG